MPGFDPFLLFRVLRHCTQIRSLSFVSSSPASRPNSIPSFCFEFSSIELGFDPFFLFRVVRHRARIRSFHFVSGSLASYPDKSLHFVSGSPTSCPDLIPSFCFEFFGIVLGFDPLFLLQVLQHHAQISLSFSASCVDHSSSKALCSGFSLSSNRGNPVPLAFGTG